MSFYCLTQINEIEIHNQSIIMPVNLRHCEQREIQTEKRLTN